MALQPEELAAMADHHVEVGVSTAWVAGKVCRACGQSWPCPTSRLAAEVERLNVEVQLDRER